MKRLISNAWTNLSTTWQFFIAIAGVGLVLVVVSTIGLRLFFTHNFNAYLAAQEQQRLQELAVLVADFYELQRSEDPSFELHQLGDLQRGGARRLLAGLSLAQWRDDIRSARHAGESQSLVPGGRFNFREVRLYDHDGDLITGRAVDRANSTFRGRSEHDEERLLASAEIRVPIIAGVPAQTVGYLGSPRPVGPLQPIDTVFQQQQMGALALAAILAIVSAALAAGWLASRLRQRLRLVAGAARQLAHGDYTTRIQVRGRDDLSALGEDVNQLAHSLQAASRQRREFMGDVAHELRTPLTILQAELEAMEDGIRRPDDTQINLLQRQVRQLTQLVNDIHSLADAEVGSLNYRWDRLDLTDWLSGQWPSLQHQAEATGLTAQLQRPNEQIEVRGDGERLTQLLQNLWSNSMRYTDAPGLVKLALSTHNSQAVLTIEDSAPGIAADQYEAIFARLYRAENSRNRASGGSGLGLALVKRVVEAHQGDVHASVSELGGLKITVCLPLVFSDVSD